MVPAAHPLPKSPKVPPGGGGTLAESLRSFLVGKIEAILLAGYLERYLVRGFFATWQGSKLTF